MERDIDAKVLEWFKPLQDERFDEYVKRFAKQIETREPFALVGNSLGGIMAIELSKLMSPEKVIIISSVKQRKELPIYIRLGKYISILRKGTGYSYTGLNRFLVRLLQLQNQEAFLQTVLEMHRDADKEFVRWAIDKVMKWENKTYPNQLLHLHGTRDLLFPIIFIKNCVRIGGGSHMMLMERPDEVIPLILEYLES